MSKTRLQEIARLSGTQVRARWLCQVEEGGGWRDVTMLRSFTVTWYYSLVESPTPTQWMADSRSVDPMDARAGWDPSVNGNWYSAAWAPPDEAVMVKAWITPVCSLDETVPEERDGKTVQVPNPWFWTDSGAQTGLVVSPKVEDERAARLAKPDAPASPSASLSQYGDSIVASCTVDAKYAETVVVERQDSSDAGWRQAASAPKAQRFSHEDRSVHPGHRYRYRFMCCLADGATFSDRSAATGWVDMRPALPGGSRPGARRSTASRGR